MASAGIGIAVDNLRLGPKEGLRVARQMGFTAAELGATDGPVEPRNLTQSGRRHLARHVRDLGVSLAALGGWTDQNGLSNPASTDGRIEQTCRILELAAELGVPVITTRTGPMGDAPDDSRRQLVLDALRHLGEHADKIGTRIAIETSGQSPTALHSLLDELGCPMLGVCYDPAAVILAGQHVTDGVAAVADRLILARLDDAVPPGTEGTGYEVALGQGQLDLAHYTAALIAAGYDGTHIVTRRTGQSPAADIASAGQQLAALLQG